MDIIDIALAAKKTEKSLEESGRIGKEENERVCLLQETEVLTEGEDGYYYNENKPARFTLVANRSVTVDWNGVSYKCTTAEAAINKNIIYAGNFALMGYGEDSGEDSGEPFLVCYASGGGLSIDTFVTPAPGTYTVSIYEETETITPINLKFLPDECTPAVVDLTKYPTTGGVQDGISINDQVVYMLNVSMMSGGAVQEATIKLNDTSLAKDLAAGPNVIIKATASMIDTGEHFDTYYPATVSIKQSTKLCTNAYCHATLNLSGLVSVECCFVFFTSSTSMTISLKATPFA